ncbi:hypothetical protein F985_03883 [Acinetobacter seifertii]|uniref:CopG family transcriptional regulator n=1 Tax=Acinetobacter seifertii TaxID=1530123 RepID=N8SB46_9GAMM|nr:hypothetical protein [Acinetobacter seifertii]ENU42984.1 hypothetical protein F985_03883 [Acinetobacter seifertii]
MSTLNSPVNSSRLKKTKGGRVRCVVYLPKSEADDIEKQAEEQDTSQSSIIANFYYKGKNIKPEGQNE